VELKRRHVPLQELITKSLETVGPLFAEKRHRLTVNVDSTLTVDVDPARLLQVLANLLTNAAKYTNPGGEVAVRAHAEGATAVVTVQDDGIGIQGEMLPHVFDMFVQERQGLERSRGGLGLGLAIVKALVQQHGGTVAARSEGRGLGSSFELRLPLVSAQLEGGAPSSDTREASRVAVSVTPARVLVVDDNEDAAELLATASEAMGHETRIAHDGAMALQLAESFQPQVAVLDIGLPIMDGYELARRLRARGKLPRLIALTGYGQERDKQESRSAGFDQHIVKPVNLQHLGSSIEKLIER
jgi:CheY-like chemotaxis protein